MKNIYYTPSIYDVMCLFEEYNEKFFNGELMLPRFSLIKDKKIIGRFVCGFDENDNVDDPEILISESYEYTDDKLKDVLVHEMIHYYLAETKQDIRMKHGKAFKLLAEDFNLRYGTNIEKTVDDCGMRLVKTKKKGFLSKLFS